MYKLLTDKTVWFVYVKRLIDGQHDTAGPFDAAYLALDYADKHYPEDLYQVKIIGKQEKVSIQ